MKTRKESISDQIKRSAQDKRIGISPTIKLFIETIGDAFEEDDESSQPIDIFDISDILLEPNNNQDESDHFHDTTDSEHVPNK